MPCDVCEREGTGVTECDDCGREICLNHVDDHDCDGDGVQPEHLEGIQTEMRTNWGESSESARSEPQTATTSTSGKPNQNTGGNSGNTLVGALLMLTGAVLSLSVVGAIVGVPLGMIGFALVFPRFTKVMVGLSVLAFLFLMMVLL